MELNKENYVSTFQLIDSTFSESIKQMNDLITIIKKYDSETFFDTAETQELLSLIPKFVDFIKHGQDFLKISGISQSNLEKMIKLNLHLFSILKGMAQSLKTSDFISAHDLITEELRDNLSLWKITLLPIIRNLAVNTAST